MPKATDSVHSNSQKQHDNRTSKVYNTLNVLVVNFTWNVGSHGMRNVTTYLYPTLRS